MEATVDQLLQLPANRLTRRQRKTLIEHARAKMREAAAKFEEALGEPAVSAHRLEREVGRRDDKRSKGS